jgi:hypothetical protein
LAATFFFGDVSANCVRAYCPNEIGLVYDIS